MDLCFSLNQRVWVVNILMFSFHSGTEGELHPKLPEMNWGESYYGAGRGKKVVGPSDNQRVNFKLHLLVNQRAASLAAFKFLAL